MEKTFWLSTILHDHKPEWPRKTKNIEVKLSSSDTIQSLVDRLEFRTSPIFPLEDKNRISFPDSYYIYFYFFENAYRVLGRILEKGTEQLKTRVWYSVGLASIILISEEPKLNTELLNLANIPPIDTEEWYIDNNYIQKVKCKPQNKKESFAPETITITDYSHLPCIYKVVVDEFVASISTLAPKLARHLPSEFDAIPHIIEQINTLVSELVYLNILDGDLPSTLGEYNEKLLRKNPRIREQLIHQNIDRIIQVNAALSYVCTQALTGAAPILERRSIIRRHSLLGVGSAILALNRIARSIEQAFAKFPVENVIEKSMVIAPSLTGTEKPLYYDPTKWNAEGGVDRFFELGVNPRNQRPKLPYFSGRLGYRETEYTISAAQHAITSGSSLDWSLLTITHELVHGHVRNILDAIFTGNVNDLPEIKQKDFYERFAASLNQGNQLTNINELDSIRNIIFTYCSRSPFSGSLTSKPKDKIKTSFRNEEFKLFPQQHTWELLRRENRSIHEIFSHILDFHYFYDSCIQAYIPLIWRSWAAVPHVRLDIRQYILRSLLTIAATIPPNTRHHSRFEKCVQQLGELLSKQASLEIPLIQAVIQYLKDEQHIKDLFPTFDAGLVLVDLVNEIFVSDKIKSELNNDTLIDWETVDPELAQRFKYAFPDHFSEEKVTKPSPYLVSRAVILLDSPNPPDGLEARTAQMLLACCSG